MNNIDPSGNCSCALMFCTLIVCCFVLFALMVLYPKGL